ncbi:MAG: hypothetical protein Crog4KO_21090 [Crocinitomicaceae bacterium]
MSQTQSCVYVEANADDGAGNAKWQSSGVTLNANEEVSFKAGGAASTRFTEEGGVNFAGPNGLSYDIPNSLAPSINGGTVIGRIGGGAAFKIGETATIRQHAGGSLELAFNDSVASDNKGGFFVGITVGS